jgi:amino-acid N-acetyltransferase
MNIRKAKMADVPKIQSLINSYADQGLMLPRPLNMIYEGLRDFIVAENQGEIVATGALHVVWQDLAEVRSMAVAPTAAGKGFGRKLVETLLDEARALGVTKVFALTYQPGFFTKCGFFIVSKEALPHKVWKECINCPKFPNCDEIAMEREV